MRTITSIAIVLLISLSSNIALAGDTSLATKRALEAAGFPAEYTELSQLVGKTVCFAETGDNFYEEVCWFVTEARLVLEESATITLYGSQLHMWAKHNGWKWAQSILSQSAQLTRITKP